MPEPLGQAIAEERPLARAIDYGLIAPRLPELYEFEAESLDQPRLPELLNDGTPAYAWPHEHRLIWHAGNAAPTCAPSHGSPARQTGTTGNSADRAEPMTKARRSGPSSLPSDPSSMTLEPEPGGDRPGDRDDG